MIESPSKDEGKIIDLTLDTAFKSFLTNEKNKWYLSFIISYCTKIDEKEIKKHIKYKSNFITNRDLNKRTSDADILVEVKNKIINIEMNREVTEKLIKKNKKYVNMLDSINTEKSKTNKIDDKYIVQINISTSPRIKGTNELLYEIVQMDKNLKVEDAYNNYIIYDINLEKLKEMTYNVDKLTPSEKRLLIFAERDKERLKMIYKGDVDMKKAVEDLDTAKYFEEFDKICEIYNTDEYKEAIHQEAIEDARKEAKEEEIKEIAKEMLKENLSIEQISKITNLTKDKIESLKDSSHN